MSDSHVQGDTRYLFKRDKTWWVKVAVPRTLRDVLGYDLRRSLHTHDIETARHGGVLSVATHTGYDPPERLAEAQPDLTVPDLARLKRLLQ